MLVLGALKIKFNKRNSIHIEKIPFHEVKLIHFKLIDRYTYGYLSFDQKFEAVV